MEKVRIHELAKVLNTNSKRIIEKLGEINIYPKGPMSYLEPGEYNKLRKHLGMPAIEASGPATQESNSAESGEVSKTAVTKSKAGGLGQPNTIIKRRFITHEEDNKPNKPSNTGTAPRRATASSGLRAGYVVRDEAEVTYATGGKAAGSRKKPTKTPQKVDRSSEPESVSAVKQTEAENKIEENTMSHEATVKPETAAVQPVQEAVSNAPSEKQPSNSVQSEESIAEPKAAKVAPAVKTTGSQDDILDLIIEDDEPVKPVQKAVSQTAKEEKTDSVKSDQAAAAPSAGSAETHSGEASSVSPSQNRSEQGTYQGQNRTGQSGGYQGQNRTDQSGGYQGQNRTGQSGGYQGQNRTGQSGGYQGQNRTGQSGGYQGQNRTGQSGGYQGQNRTGQSGGYQGQNRTGQSGGYQGQNRTGQSGGYQGQNRTGQSGGYQGQNRTGQSGGYQGQNRTGQSGGYQGQNRTGQSGGYQGQNRNGQGGGYQGQNRTGQGGGYQGQNRNGQGGGYRNTQGGYQPRNAAGGYVPGKDDDDDRPAYQRKQFPRKDEPKSDSLVQKADLSAKIEEQKKEAQAREQEKYIKRENKKESAPRANPAVTKGKRNNKLDMPFVGEKKGVNEVFSDDFVLEGIAVEDKAKFKRGNRNRRGRRNEPVRPMQQPIISVLTHVTLPESMTVKELAETLKKTAAEVMKKMLLMGIVATVNQVIDFPTAEIIADEFGIKATQEVVVTEEDVLFDDVEDNDDEGAVTRPPVVVVMGHVDHGKTSLLDAIRSAHVVTGEAGGITQHIGAYTVNIKDRDITFLDTPGHEAFTAMRARGAQTTDIAILVVAADDGVMPQTVESINHAKAANVSLIVAVNKIDKPGANVERVMQELTEHGIVAEEWGGDAIFVPVSAKKRENIDTLLEMVLLTADMMELKANPNKQPKGTVIEAKLDKNRGPVATVLVQRGTLRLGDSVVTGTTVGRIRAMTDDKGAAIKEAGPSIPVEILGLPEVPQAGEVFYGITDERMAKQLAEKRRDKIKEEQNKAKTMVSLDDLFSQIQEGNIKEINIIVKADVQGSVEAVKQSLEKLSNEDVRVRIIHGAVGAINESDISLAQVSNAMIIGFNVRPGTNVQAAAEDAGVDMRLYTVIYSAIEDVSAAMKGMLDPTFKEVVQGHAEIRQIYKVSGVGTIAGCYVTDGKITRNSDVRIIRDGIVVCEGKLASLKRFKDDVKEVLTNYECGLSVEKYNDLKELDVVESYVIEEVKRV